MVKTLITKIKDGFARIYGNPVDRLCDIISAAGVGFLWIGITTAISFFALGAAGLPVITYLLPAIWYFAAYILQSVVIAAFGNKREADYSWEGSSNYFSARQALPVFLVCAVGILLTHGFWFEFYRQQMLKGLLSTFDNYSIHPYISQLASFLMMCSGIRSAFFPSGQLMSQRRVLTSSGAAFVLFAVVMAANSGSSLGWLLKRFEIIYGVCFIIYITSAAVILNQSVIVRKSQTTTVARIGNNARIYDLRMVLLWIAAAIVVGAAAFIIISGIWYILKFLILIAIWYILNNRSGKASDEITPSEINDMVYEGNNFAGPAMVIGAILTLLIVILMIIFIRTGAVQAFFKAIYAWFESIIGLFMGRDVYTPETEINFKDEIEMMSVNKSVRETQLRSRRGKLTLRDFSGHLASLKNDSDKLTYSYVVMIDILREFNQSLEKGDTPRELAEKIKSTTTVDDIDGITRAIELVSYAEKSLLPEDSKKALDAVCKVVEKRLA